MILCYGSYIPTDFGLIYHILPGVYRTIPGIWTLLKIVGALEYKPIWGGKA